MLRDSLLTGSSYSPTDDKFVTDGCTLGDIDLSHVYMNCNHTTIYGLQFL